MDNSSVKTIDRLVSILDYFTHVSSSASLADLASYLKLPKSTLHRFLVGLEANGILRRDGTDKRWHLGYHLISWGSAASESANLRQLAAPVMRSLVEMSGETAILTVYSNHKIICLDLCETSHSVRLRIQIGAYQPAHAGASSKALTAYLPPDEVDAIVQETGLPRLAANTYTDYEALKLELARIRATGYATSLEETDTGAWGVATPIRDWRDDVVAAIGLAGPVQRYKPELVQRYADYCRDAAETISSYLNARIPHKDGLSKAK